MSSSVAVVVDVYPREAEDEDRAVGVDEESDLLRPLEVRVVVLDLTPTVLNTRS